MNIANFKENVDLMSHSGFKVTQMEAAVIENSLIILQSANKFKDIFFFGKLEALGNQSYYIAFGYRRDILKDMKFFYSMNACEWVTMPDVKLELMEVAKKAVNILRGDPAHMEEVYMNPKFITDDSEMFLSCPHETKFIKEDDRLACIVHSIMKDSAIVPRTSLSLQLNRCVTLNPFFQGLTISDASQLKNFQLLRYPVNDRYQNLTKHEDFNFLTDLFDTIDDIFPASCFTIRTIARDVCLIRSLKWPGMVFLHKLNTPHQGFVYFGNGRENLDMLFMIN